MYFSQNVGGQTRRGVINEESKVVKINVKETISLLRAIKILVPTIFFKLYT